MAPPRNLYERTLDMAQLSQLYPGALIVLSLFWTLRWARILWSVAFLLASVPASALLLGVVNLSLLPFPRARLASASYIVAAWQAWVASLLRYGYGVRFSLSGDALPDGPVLLLCNHRTRIDWLILWGALPFSRLVALKILLKQAIGDLPLIGPACAMARYIFLQRRWAEDARHLDLMLTHVCSCESSRGGDLVLLLFPEGTDLHPAATVKSDAWAAQHGLPPRVFTLHPRSTGLAACIDTLTKCGATPTVVDATLAYSGKVPSQETSLLGWMPSAVHVLLRVVDKAALKKGMEPWLRGAYAAKEERLRSFYEDGVLTDGAPADALPPPSPQHRRLHLIAGCMFVVATVWLCVRFPVPVLAASVVVGFANSFVASSYGGWDRLALRECPVHGRRTHAE